MTGETSAAEDALLAAQAEALADGIVAALPGWVEASVARLALAWSGAVRPEVAAAAAAAGAAAQAAIGPEVRALLAQDVDDQRTTPLALARGAVPFATDVLRAIGVPPVVRDAQAAERFPDDDYDLTPGTFSDLDPALAEPGLAWGAAKAYVVLARRRGR